MRIHLTTAVGGYVRVLPHMLRHYRALGVESFFVHVNLLHEDDPILDQVRALCDVTSVSIGGALWRGKPAGHRPARARRPRDRVIIPPPAQVQGLPRPARA